MIASERNTTTAFLAKDPAAVLFGSRLIGYGLARAHAIIQSIDGASITWLSHSSPGYKRLLLISPDLSTVANFSFQEEDTTSMMNGQWFRDTINTVARRKSDSQFLLVERGSIGLMNVLSIDNPIRSAMFPTIPESDEWVCI